MEKGFHGELCNILVVIRNKHVQLHSVRLFYVRQLGTGTLKDVGRVAWMIILSSTRYWQCAQKLYPSACLRSGALVLYAV